MPSTEVYVRYRLLDPLPITLRTELGIVCRLHAVELTSAHGAHLYLRVGSVGDYFLQGYSSIEDLHRDLFETGIGFPAVSRGASFFASLVRAGKAILVTGEHCVLPTYYPKAGT